MFQPTTVSAEILHVATFVLCALSIGGDNNPPSSFLKPGGKF